MAQRTTQDQLKGNENQNNQENGAGEILGTNP